MKTSLIFKLFIFFFISSQCVAESCPADNFDDFSRVFINDAKVQFEYTVSPVETIFYQEQDDDVKEVKESRVLKFSDFPIVNSKGYDGEREIYVDKEKLEVVVKGDDSGYQISLSFSPKKRCWYLVKITDYSM
jgi:type VI secretion system secreted protein VgrG